MTIKEREHSNRQMLNGEIGSLIQDDKQIGGFLNWTIELNLTSTERPQGREYKKVITKGTAERYWLLCSPSQSEITALYYQLIKDRLVLVNQAQVKINLDTVIDKMINKKLEMIWMT